MTDQEDDDIDAKIEALLSDDTNYANIDLSRATFQKHLIEAATLARDFTRTMVTNVLPDAIVYTIYYGCSYDGNPRVEDEKTFPGDYDQDPITTHSPEEVTNCLWRNGFVPEWINVAVAREDGQQTYIKLECCGRYSALPKMMYHVGEGRPPFHVLGPPLPPQCDLEAGEKFDLYWCDETDQPVR